MALQGLRSLGSSAARRSGGLSAYGRTPEEAEQSLLSKIGGVTLGGLATVGNVLDLPGSFVRDLLAGENPLDQFLTPTRADNRVSGRQLLEQHFGLRKNRETGFVPLADPGEFGRDLLGFGAEVVTDPLSFLTFGGGALTKSGKAAEKAGLMPFLKSAGLNRASKAGGRQMGVREARTTLGISDLLKATPDVERYTDQLRAVLGGKNATRSSAEMVAGRDPRATLISSQDVLYPGKVDEYLRSGAKDVELSPVLNIDGQRFQMVMDGHHRLEAARRAGIDPEFVVPDLGKLGPEQAAFSYPSLNRLVQGKITPEDFIEKMRVGNSYRDILTGKLAEIPDTRQASLQAEKALQALLKTNEPLGYTVGIGLPFGQAVAGTNLGPLGDLYNRGADRLGMLAGKTGPVRALRYLFDPSVKGQIDPLKQEVAELASTYTKPGEHQARDAVLRQAEARQPLQAEFDQMFGEQLARPAYDSRLDPRDLDPVINRVLEQQRAVYDADPIGQINRQFRSENPSIVQQSRRDVDPSAIKDFDILFEQYNTATGRNLSESEFYDLFRQSDPRPTRQSVRGEAEEELLRQQLTAGGPVQHAFTQGDVVLAGDRGNYGYVQEVGPKTSRVFFRNPQTNAAQTVVLENDQLKRAFAGNAPQAEAYAKQVTAKVFDDIVKATAETGNVNTAFRQFVNQDAPKELGQKIAEHAEDLKSAQNAIYQAASDKGIRTTMLEDGNEGLLSHLARYVDPQVSEKATGQRVLKTGFGSTKARTPETRDLPEFVINELHRSSRYRGKDASKKIQQDFGEYLNGRYGEAADEFNFGDEAAELGKQRHADAVATWLQGRKTRDLYTKDYLDNHARYMRGAEMVSATADAIHDVLRRKATTDPAGIPLTVALEKSGLDPQSASAYFAQRHGADPASLFVDEDTVRSIRGVTEIINNSEWGGVVGKFVDDATRMFKRAVTTPFPGFAFRNHSSGQHLNLASGYVNGLVDLKDYTKSYREMFRLQKLARDSPDLLSDAQRGRLRELSAYNVIQPRGFMDIDLLASQPQAANQTTQIVPSSALAIGDTVRSARTHVAENPLNVPGLRNKAVQKARVAGESVLQTGANANALVEWQNRTVMFDYLRNKGWSPEAAASKVNELQFDYSDISQFERDVMRRALPFYGFTRKVLPLITNELMQRPGGGIAQTIRATRQGQDDNEVLPEYVAQGTAVPWGTRDDGTQSFLTGLGLAHEVPLQFLGDGPQRAGREALSMLNPLIKGPIEYAANRSFFMDRSLDDMDPVIGRLLTKAGVQDALPGGQAKPVLNSKLLETIVSNSPISRLATTARQVLDERKTNGDKLLNLLTGARVTDVSEAAKDATLRDMLESMMKTSGARTFSTTRFGRDVIEELQRDNPEQAERLAAFNEYLNLLSRKAKSRSRK